MGRNPLYFTNPDLMIPSRWVRKNAEKMENFNHTPLAYMPWGVGARSCIGRRLAESIMHILLYKLLENSDVKALNKLEPIMKMVMVPDKPAKIKLTPIPIK